MSKVKKEKTNKAKPAGTVLAERYRLGEQVGRGGFSIVYEAVDLQSGRKVAVKECTIPTEKERFLREAVLLEEYAEEDAIVSVLDFFEDADTAYIVMEFLEGETLRHCIERGGRWMMEETVKRMDPVMETLEHMHRDNVIHRDISPDNIMVLRDGSLKLLDFGAAKRYLDSTVSRFVVKANYSPPEQMDARGMFGSWSDVYSICAAMYFCITGRNPEDAISRLMSDDLKMPSELGADILPDAEKTLMSGMALDSSKRIRDMGRLRKELESIYPILSEEEKLALAKRKKRKKLLTVSAVLAAVIVCALCLYKYMPVIALNFTDTESFVLDGRDMTGEEFRENSEIAKQLMKILSDGNFSCTEGDRFLCFKVRPDVFGKYIDAEEGINCLVSAPMKFHAEDGFGRYICDLDQGKDISDVYASEDGGMSIEFTDAGKEKLKVYIDKKVEIKGTNSRIDEVNADDVNRPTDLYSYDGYIATGGKTLDILGDNKIIRSYAKAVLTGDPLSKPFTVIRKWNIEWENPDKAEVKGTGQVREEALEPGSQDGKKLRLKYSYNPYGTEEERQKVNEDTVAKLQSMVKARLDSLGLSYAVGKDKDDKGSMIVELPSGSINYETASVLGIIMLGSYFVVGGETDSLSATSSVLYGAELAEDGGSPYLILHKQEYSNQEELDAYLDRLRSRGEKYLYLKYDGLPVARMDLEEAAEAIKNGKDVEFREWCAADGRETELQDFIRFILESPGQKNDLYENYVFTGMHAADENGNLCAAEQKKGGLLLADQTAESYIEGWRDRYGDQLRFGRSSFTAGALVDYGSKLCIEESASEQTSEESVKLLLDFLKDNKDRLGDGTFKFISYSMADSGTVMIMINEAGEYYASLIIGGSEEAEKLITESMRKDSDLSGLLTDETDYHYSD